MEIRLPMTAGKKMDGIITRWHYQEGERVRKGTVLLEYETSKMSSSILVPMDGVLQRLVAEGTAVAYDTLVGRITEDAAIR